MPELCCGLNPLFWQKVMNTKTVLLDTLTVLQCMRAHITANLFTVKGRRNDAASAPVCAGSCSTETPKRRFAGIDAPTTSRLARSKKC